MNKEFKQLTKEKQEKYCKEFALQKEKETGNFPLRTDWLVKQGFPINGTTLTKMFNNYGNFRKYCGKKEIIRTQPITLEWIKNNCLVNEMGCWLWDKGLDSYDYGLITVMNKMYKVHRFVWEIVNKPIPENLLVRHKCDVKNCCNPDHLELGTRADNTNDFLERTIDLKLTNNNKLGAKVRNLSLEERITFYLNNISKNSNDCWISNIKKPTSRGYYQIGFNNKLYYLHRLVLANNLNKKYEEINIARHTCHNKSCINPDHLIEGTLSDNQIDSRQYSKQTKLTKEKVIKIRKDLINRDFSIKGSKTKFDKKWANIFNVAFQTIVHIRLGNTWKDIKDEN